MIQLTPLECAYLTDDELSLSQSEHCRTVFSEIARARRRDRLSRALLSLGVGMFCLFSVLVAVVAHDPCNLGVLLLMWVLERFRGYDIACAG